MTEHNPLTSNRQYTDEEREFMVAMDRYKHVQRRPHPGWSEVLDVLRSLGYRRVEPTVALPTFCKGTGESVLRGRGV